MENDTFSGRTSLSDTITCEELDRRQYENDMEILRIELESTRLKMESQRHEYQYTIEAYMEKAEDAERQTKFYQAKLIQQEHEPERVNQKIEIQEIVQRQKILEATNQKLQGEAKMLEEGLSDLTVDETEYGIITLIPHEKRSIKDAAKIKLFETLQPIKTERDLFKAQIDALSEAFASESQKSQNSNFELAEAKESKNKWHSMFIEKNIEFETARDLVATNHEKAMKFDEIKTDLDAKLNENLMLGSQLKHATLSKEDITEKHKELFMKYETTRKREEVLLQDTKHLKEQNYELTMRKSDLEKINSDLMDRNLRLQTAREELVEKYLNGADQARIKANNEQLLQLSEIQNKTDHEMEKIKNHLTELFCREADALRHSRDNAEKERDNLRGQNEQLQNLLSDANNSLSVLRIQAESECSEAAKQVTYAELEVKRFKVSKHELERILDQTKRDATAEKSKNEALSNEVIKLRSQYEKVKINSESDIRDLTRQLNVYEKMEVDLDALAMECADPENPLGDIGTGICIPASSQRRMQQCARLAKRVINLEKINADMKRELESLKLSNRSLSDQLKSAENAMNKVDQPYAYLVQNQRDKDTEIGRLKETVHNQNKQTIKLEERIYKLTEIKDQLTFDMEKLLSNQDFIGQMKRSLLQAHKLGYVNGSENQPEPITITKKTYR